MWGKSQAIEQNIWIYQQHRPMLGKGAAIWLTKMYLSSCQLLTLIFYLCLVFEVKRSFRLSVKIRHPCLKIIARSFVENTPYFCISVGWFERVLPQPHHQGPHRGSRRQCLARSEGLGHQVHSHFQVKLWLFSVFIWSRMLVFEINHTLKYRSLSRGQGGPKAGYGVHLQPQPWDYAKIVLNKSCREGPF